MKREKILSGLAAVWIMIIILDGLGMLIRAWYTRRMNRVLRIFYGLIRYFRTFSMIVLALINFFLVTGRSDRKNG